MRFWKAARSAWIKKPPWAVISSGSNAKAIHPFLFIHTHPWVRLALGLDHLDGSSPRQGAHHANYPHLMSEPGGVIELVVDQRSYSEFDYEEGSSAPEAILDTARKNPMKPVKTPGGAWVVYCKFLYGPFGINDDISLVFSDEAKALDFVKLHRFVIDEEIYFD